MVGDEERVDANSAAAKAAVERIKTFEEVVAKAVACLDTAVWEATAKDEEDEEAQEAIAEAMSQVVVAVEAIPPDDQQEVLKVMPPSTRKYIIAVMDDKSFSQVSPPGKDVSKGKDYEVQCVLDKRFRGGVLEYKLKFEGHKVPEWIKAKGCDGCKEMVEDYERHEALAAGEGGGEEEQAAAEGEAAQALEAALAPTPAEEQAAAEEVLAKEVACLDTAPTRITHALRGIDLGTNGTNGALREEQQAAAEGEVIEEVQLLIELARSGNDQQKEQVASVLEQITYDNKLGELGWHPVEPGAPAGPLVLPLGDDGPLEANGVAEEGGGIQLRPASSGTDQQSGQTVQKAVHCVLPANSDAWQREENPIMRLPLRLLAEIAMIDAIGAQQGDCSFFPVMSETDVTRLQRDFRHPIADLRMKLGTLRQVGVGPAYRFRCSSSRRFTVAPTGHGLCGESSNVLTQPVCMELCGLAKQAESGCLFLVAMPCKRSDVAGHHKGLIDQVVRAASGALMAHLSGRRLELFQASLEKYGSNRGGGCLSLSINHHDKGDQACSVLHQDKRCLNGSVVVSLSGHDSHQLEVCVDEGGGGAYTTTQLQQAGNCVAFGPAVFYRLHSQAGFSLNVFF